ncbi:MAG: glycosyltransferase family 2 protein [Chloroflexi bacterium]|nr:glycosyltransferase family 2 protein [Chloroflexota bacterium]
MAQPYLSIVIPAYNEEMRIAQTLDTVVKYAGGQDYSWEVVVADDGSQDGTASLVEAAAEANLGIRLVRLSHGGKGWAVRGGMLEARGQYRFLADADLSMPIEHLQRFLPPNLTDFDVAIGSREAPGARRFHEPFRRHLMGRAFNIMVRLLAVKGLSDTQCGFKCFDAKAAETLFPLQRAKGFGFDVEILFLAQRLGMHIKEVPIDWYYHEGSKVKPVRDSFLMLKDLLSVRWTSLKGRYGNLLHKTDKSHPSTSEGNRSSDNQDMSD